ncbi:hypothetical protein CRG98_023703 [Punica granatum]|uniref:CCHC-type domain-containing protein n=1 Tax=Punica granatum TaxID=22663 RepID=A0A2I0JI29_PUNGR|nr:hypothetical protein CRG98_023703 [Punica granatum]
MVCVTQKTIKWDLANADPVESTHPPLGTLQIIHQKAEVKASPFKMKVDDSLASKDIKNIFEQNNFTNQCLHTIGSQLDRIEQEVTKPVVNQVDKKVEKTITCSGDCSRKHKPKYFHKKSRIPSKPPTTDKGKKKSSSLFKCFKCGKTGHTQRYCYLNKKIHQLEIDDDIKDQVCNLLIESSDSDTDYSSASEESLQADELDWSSDEKSINVLTRDHEFLLEIADQIQNPLLRKQYLEKLQQGTLEGEIKTPNYNLSEILKRHDQKRTHKTSFDVHKELDNLRSEIVCIKFEQQQHSTIIGRLEELFAEAGSSEQVLMKQDKNPEETLALDQTKNDGQKTLTIMGELSPNKWLIKIKLVINHNLFVDATALFDIGADENCINEQLIPARFYERTTESLSSVSGTKLDIQYKLSEEHGISLA